MSISPSDHMRKQMERIRHKPLPKGRFNATTAERMLEFGWAESVSLPSPYMSKTGRMFSALVHLRITAAGLAALDAPADAPA